MVTAMFSAHRLFSAGLLAAAVLGSSACAFGSTYYRYPVAAPRVDERAYTRGYDEGRVRGESDARRNRSFDYSRHGEYRSADAGYRGYGDRNEYRSLFRQGFVTGYNDGYRRFARGSYGYPAPGYSSGRYGSPASQNGYRDGFEQGRDDARDGGRFDPVRSIRYRSADRDYNNRYGSREEYRREYRAAFQTGYEQGYRGFRR